MAEIISGKPYKVIHKNSKFETRVFSSDVDDSEFVWHRDTEDRELEILEGNGWQFQFDKCLPWLLEKGMIFDIQHTEYHRLIKGQGQLKVRIYRNVK